MPKPPASGPSGTVDQSLQSAIHALQIGRPDEAERLAAGVLKANRANSAAATVLARALMTQGRAADAIPILERVARRGDDAAIETLLAASLAAAGRHEEALGQLRRTVARRPPFMPAFLELASQLGHRGQYGDAIGLLEEGAALLPGAVQMQVELAFLHVKRNERSIARALLSRATEAAPHRPEVWAAVAQIAQLDGDYAAAADFYRRALALRPDDAMTRKNLGTCLLEMNERAGGEMTIRTAVRAAPQLAGLAMFSLAAASHGRFFLSMDRAQAFLRGEKS
ncbi:MULTISPECIES: tetratricopeptide repeat protein [Bradyrhizobium]|jgi:Tfp pilus assembly protein PilF|uniref:tetratricopeptide repeat protein n=1 Tax=Bradyrhizobium TaxID=374 RepID=UPI001BACEA92|nr:MULTISPECIES: tetratricopeptide repeat protein [Bradyrhizobium]MBR0812896.1 tetratricopeptide repeat protein [Bradyrhizobium diazoefficiens]WOH70533.1 tetratricopeptide repeat protein [Bradyrhizobium sp. NDS-1]